MVLLVSNFIEDLCTDNTTLQFESFRLDEGEEVVCAGFDPTMQRDILGVRCVILGGKFPIGDIPEKTSTGELARGKEGGLSHNNALNSPIRGGRVLSIDCGKYYYTPPGGGAEC